MEWTYTTVTIYKGIESKGYGEMCMEEYMQDRVKQYLQLTDDELEKRLEESFILGTHDGFDPNRLESVFENYEAIEEFFEHPDCLSGLPEMYANHLEVKSTHPQFNLLIKYLEDEYYDWNYYLFGNKVDRIFLDEKNNCEIENLEKFKEIMDSYDEFVIEFCVFNRE
jgi:hypothetical protein